MRKRRQQRNHEELLRSIDRLEHELGLDDDGLVDLSTDPVEVEPTNYVQVHEAPPLVRLMDRVGQKADPPRPRLWLDWERDASGGLVPKPRPAIPLHASAWNVYSSAGNAYPQVVDASWP